MVSELNECIILGGGASIKEGLSLGLKDLIKNKFVILTNYSYKHFDGTLLCFCDRDFYKTTDIRRNPDICDELKALPLIIGANHNGIDKIKLSNTELIRLSSTFKKINNIKEGLYTQFALTGIFAISLASFLMNYKGTLFICGFDWTKEGETHYYSKDEINHRGNGWVSSYKNHNPKNIFKPFENVKELKIYNVSPTSNIQNFEKISYKMMFNLLTNKVFNQEELRSTIKIKICIE